MASFTSRSASSVNAVAPGIVKTPTITGADYEELAAQHPLGRMAEISDIVQRVIYLEQATFVTARLCTSTAARPPDIDRRSPRLFHRRFDDGNVLLRRSAAHSDAGDHLALTGERHAAAHRGVSAARDGEEGIEGRAWLHEGDEVSGAYADEGRRVGLSLGELEGERGRSGHAVGENDVAVDVDDGNRDGHVWFLPTRPRRGQQCSSRW